MKYIISILSFTLLFSSLQVYGQVDSLNEKASQLAKKRLVYYVRYKNHKNQPRISDTRKYGFRIKRRVIAFNRRAATKDDLVLKEINKIYGINWFENNLCSFVPQLCRLNFSGKISTIIYSSDSTRNDTIPIANAKITILDSDTNQLEGPLYTDSYGKYKASLWSLGSMRKIEKEGYYTIIKNSTSWRPLNSLIWDVYMTRKKFSF